jgi:Na+/H+ antiporter NhaD/arsenite permease-like protein
MLFLFGVFTIGQAMEESGYLSNLSYKLFNRAKNLDTLVLFILFGIGILSAILMNDTLAIIGTGVVQSRQSLPLPNRRFCCWRWLLP